MARNEISSIEGSSTTISGLPTVVDAIQKAGGITKNANITRVILQRRIPGKDISYKQASLNLASLIMRGQQVQNPFLFDGDIIKLVKAEKLQDNPTELISNNLSAQLMSMLQLPR